MLSNYFGKARKKKKFLLERNSERVKVNKGIYCNGKYVTLLPGRFWKIFKFQAKYR